METPAELGCTEPQSSVLLIILVPHSVPVLSACSWKSWAWALAGAPLRPRSFPDVQAGSLVSEIHISVICWLADFTRGEIPSFGPTGLEQGSEVLS